MSLVSHSTTTIVEMDAASKALAEAPPALSKLARNHEALLSVK
jgi:hypothetical protein